MHRMRAAVVALLALATASFPIVQTHSQGVLTLPENLARGGGWVAPSPPSGPGPSMREILSSTDIIVRAVVGQPQMSYLSTDQREVLTDYPLVKPNVLYLDGTRHTTQPGTYPPITVTVRGGTV